MKGFLIVFYAFYSVVSCGLSFHYFTAYGGTPEIGVFCGGCWMISAVCSAATFGMRVANV